MKRSTMQLTGCVVLVFAVSGLCGAPLAWAQTTPSRKAISTRAANVAKANQQAEARLQAAVKLWRAKFAAIGEKQRFRRMVSKTISLEEKLGQGGDVFAKQREDRIRRYLREQVVDERQLATAMALAFDELQRELMKESIALYAQAGVDRKTVEKVYPTYHVDTGPWVKAFDPLLAEARKMAQADLMRFGAITVGSSVVSDGLRDVGRQTGMYRAEKGSWTDFFTGLAIELTIDAIADEVTDPSEEYAGKLQSRFLTAQKQVLEGPSGLLACMRKITDLHQQSRNQHFGLVEKAVTK